MSDASTVALLSAVAGLLALDMTEALQVMVSRPLVAACLAGAAVGDAPLGLAVGVTLELVWLGVLPVGGAPFPDSAVASVVGVGVGILAGRAEASFGWSTALGVLAAIGTGVLGGRVVGIMRRLNGRLSAHAESRAREGEAGGVRTAVILGLTCRFASAAALAGLALALAAAVIPHVPGLDHPGRFPTLVWAAPIAAAGLALGGKGRLEVSLLCVGFAAGIVVALLR